MCRLWLNTRNVLVATGVLAGLTLAASGGNAAAAQGKRNEPQKLSNAQLRKSLQVLHAVKYTLEKADHDYGGHRVAAVRDIKAAEHQLRLALHAVQKKNPNPGVKGGKPPAQPEPQALSDAQLAEAIPVLQQTVTVLNGANHDYGGHRAHAVRDLNQAIRQLQKALQFRQNKK